MLHVIMATQLEKRMAKMKNEKQNWRYGYEEIVSKREFLEVNNEAWGEDEMKDFIVTKFKYCPFCGRKFGK